MPVGAGGIARIGTYAATPRFWMNSAMSFSGLSTRTPAPLIARTRDVIAAARGGDEVVDSRVSLSLTINSTRRLTVTVAGFPLLNRVSGLCRGELRRLDH